MLVLKVLASKTEFVKNKKIKKQCILYSLLPFHIHFLHKHLNSNILFLLSIPVLLTIILYVAMTKKEVKVVIEVKNIWSVCGNERFSNIIMDAAKAQ